MAMYVYFDKNGVLQEIVQDKSVRVGDYKANRIYMYFDTSATISDVWFIMQSPDGVLSTEVSIKDNQIDLSIPYQKNRDLHFFQDYQTYHFYYYDLDSVEVQYSGLAYATVRANVDNALYAQGLITFNVESNVIKLDNGITQSQYDYLLVTYSKTKELTEELQAKVNELEANLNAEIERATNEENTLNKKIYNEITRAQQVESSINQALNAHIDNKENPHSVTKEQIGLGNVNNTSDLDKPMSTATKDYIDTKVSGAMVYRGSVQKFSDLPTDAQNGDVYNVVEAHLAYPPNTNYAWNGSSWDPLGGSLADVYAKLNEKVDLSTMQLINGQKTFVEPLNMQKGNKRVTINYGNIKYNDLTFALPKITGLLVVEDQVLMKPSTPVEFLLIGIEPTGSGTQVSVKLGSNLSYDSTTKTLNASGGGVPVLEELPTEVVDNTPKVFYCKNELYIVQEPVSSGETWVLKSSGMVVPSNTIDETINFTNLIGTAFTRITIKSEGKGVNIAYYNGSNITYAVTGGDGVTGDNATLTFETAPTGVLLTWLQANGTKQ